MVEFKVKFNKKIGEKLAEVQYKNAVKKIRRLQIIFTIIGVVLMVYAVANSFADSFDYFAFGIGIFSLIFWLLFPKILRRNLHRQQDKISEESTIVNDLAEEVYKFDSEKVFIFTTMGENYRSAIETNYDYFSKVEEDDDCYLLYISNVQCHLIFKNSITKGTISNLANLSLISRTIF